MEDCKNLDISLDGESGGFWGLGVLHSSRSGRFDSIKYSRAAVDSLVREEIQKNSNDQVNPFLRCNDLVGLNFLHFSTKKEMDDVMCNMDSSMKVILK